MKFNEIQNCERTKIEKWSRFQLPNQWKKIGVIITLGTITIMLILKYGVNNEPSYIKEIGRRLILIGLLIITLSKEKIEDEMITSLRAKSLILAIIFGVGYAVIQPLAELFINNFVFSPSSGNIFSYFEILFYMLFIQIMFFEILKRNR